jgi:hypothetical protein
MKIGKESVIQFNIRNSFLNAKHGAEFECPFTVKKQIR